VKKPKIILIFGIFRSSTSALAGLIHKGGITMGEDLLPADWINPKGYFEDMHFIKINKKIMAKLGIDRLNIPFPYDFEANKAKVQPEIDELMALVDYYVGKYDVWGWKQPEMCFTANFWLEDLAKKAEIMKIFVTRNSINNAKSIERTLGLSFSEASYLISLYQHYMGELSNSFWGIPIHPMFMKQFIRDPKRLIDGLNEIFKRYDFQQLQYTDHIDKTLVHFGKE